MTDTDRPHRNRLAGETSPYLLQHAGNPVDWYPWGEEAFAKAREEDKPILLSVGYSSCHWCHVMAHESFESEEIAALMNDGFVSIKVDREERPDIDAVYMAATQALAGQGGWPMTVFLTPERKPFYAGTYFPPEDGFGRPGFPRLLESIRHAWEHDRDGLLATADAVTERLREAAGQAGGGDGRVTLELPAQAVAVFRAAFDPRWGGFSAAPKFPSPGNLEFLLMHHARAERAGAGAVEHPGALEMALRTLRGMARGGIYDQLGGGFARYSVDGQWLVPHFEKMLYDNAQLVRSYLHAYQLTGERLFERTARETLGYLMREMLDDEGGFYSAQDADSEGIEGTFFLWTVEQVQEVLGPFGDGDVQLFNTYFGVTAAGNFQDPHHPELIGRNVLSVPREPEAVAGDLGMGVEELEAKLAGLREAAFDARERRVRPGLDDKVLTSWNGLALAAFAEAARVLGDSPDGARYLAVAKRNAAFVRERLWRDGALLHSYKHGVAKIDGMLEDYACYGLGLIELYRATGDLDALTWATELFEVILARFHDEERGGFFDTPVDGEPLLLRQKSFFDAATPSGNGAAALLAIWLGRYYDRREWEQFGREVVAQVEGQLLAAPSGFGAIWQAVELLLAPRREIAIVGEPARRDPLEREIARHFLPATVIAPASGGGGLPLLEGRELAEGATAYVCEEMVCELPVTTPEELAAQLRP